METRTCRGGNEKLKVNVQVVESYHCTYHAHEQYQYLCLDNRDLGHYVGHAFGINK